MSNNESFEHMGMPILMSTFAYHKMYLFSDYIDNIICDIIW